MLVTNPDNSDDTHQFWTYSIRKTNPFQDWSEWWVLIGGLMVMHGMDLADEPPDYEEPPDYGDDDYDEDYDEPGVLQVGDDYEEPEPPAKPSLVIRILRRVGRWFR